MDVCSERFYLGLRSFTQLISSFVLRPCGGRYLLSVQEAAQNPPALPFRASGQETGDLLFASSSTHSPLSEAPFLTTPWLHLRFPLCCASCRKKHNLTISPAWIVQKSPNHCKLPQHTHIHCSSLPFCCDKVSDH